MLDHWGQTVYTRVCVYTWPASQQQQQQQPPPQSRHGRYTELRLCNVLCNYCITSINHRVIEKYNLYYKKRFHFIFYNVHTTKYIKIIIKCLF